MDSMQANLDEISERQHGSLTAAVHRALEDMILRGQLEPGARLNEQQMAQHLGVSRGPIREACRLLERDGLVVSSANQGVFVRQLSLDDALELYDLRAEIAGYCCAVLAKTASADHRAELRDMIAQMGALVEASDEEAYFRMNLAFHERLAALSGARRAAKIYAALDKEVRLLRRRVLRGIESLRLSHEEHQKIVAAIEAGDAEAASEAARSHHLGGKNRWIKTL